jgi:hypothetical protein
MEKNMDIIDIWKESVSHTPCAAALHPDFTDEDAAAAYAAD